MNKPGNVQYKLYLLQRACIFYRVHAPMPVAGGATPVNGNWKERKRHALVALLSTRKKNDVLSLSSL